MLDSVVVLATALRALCKTHGWKMDDIHGLGYGQGASILLHFMALARACRIVDFASKDDGSFRESKPLQAALHILGAPSRRQALCDSMRDLGGFRSVVALGGGLLEEHLPPAAKGGASALPGELKSDKDPRVLIVGAENSLEFPPGGIASTMAAFQSLEEAPKSPTSSRLPMGFFVIRGKEAAMPNTRSDIAPCMKVWG